MPEDLRWNAATLWAGPKCHIVHYPLSGWKVFNLVVTCHNDAPEPVAGKPVSDDEVMQGFAHVHTRAKDIIRHGKNWKLWVLCDRDPLARWVDGRVALLGDARTRCCNISRKAPAWRWRTRCACRICWGHIRMIMPSRLSVTVHSAFRARARAAIIPRHRRAHLPPLRRTRPPPQRHHEREDVGGLLRRSAWLYGGTGLES